MPAPCGATVVPLSHRAHPPGDPSGPYDTSAPSGTGAELTALSPLLRRLVDERATGAFTRDGGTLFLVDGRVTHAESPAAPGLETLLTTGGRLAPETWRAAFAEAGRSGRVGPHLAETGLVPRGLLELCQLGTLHDAAFFVLAPGGGPGRFRGGTRHWLGALKDVPAEAVARETRRRRARLDRVWPDPATDLRPVVRTAAVRVTPAGPATVRAAAGARVPARRRAVLELADGSRTAYEIARELGRLAFHTLLDLRQLAAEGLVTTVGPAVPPVPGPAAAAYAAEGPTGPATVFAEPDIALLRRLRDALEAL